MQDLVGRLTLDEMMAQMAHGGVHTNGEYPSIIINLSVHVL